MTDTEIIILADDFKSTSMACGVMVDDFDAVGFARAVEQASRRAALEEAASIVDAEAENARQERYYPGVVGAFEECATAIRALGAKEG